MSDVDIHNLVYDVARGLGVEPKKLFEALYISVLGKPRGPRLGRFIKIIGVQEFKNI
ncbi:MAG TPA: lysine--tRNA ligase, partial [Acidilobales archaeon]|nr:lysine--tRNA ligase [Acidilobales archaeon]